MPFIQRKQNANASQSRYKHKYYIFTKFQEEKPERTNHNKSLVSFDNFQAISYSRNAA